MFRCAVLLMFKSNFTRGKKLFDPSTNVPYKTPVVHNYATFFFSFPFFFFFFFFFAPTSKEGLVFTAPVQMRGKTWPYWQNWHKLSFLALPQCLYVYVGGQYGYIGCLVLSSGTQNEQVQMKNLYFLKCNKGQKISKANYGVLNSPEKRTLG